MYGNRKQSFFHVQARGVVAAFRNMVWSPPEDNFSNIVSWHHHLHEPLALKHHENEPNCNIGQTQCCGVELWCRVVASTIYVERARAGTEPLDQPSPLHTYASALNPNTKWYTPNRLSYLNTNIGAAFGIKVRSSHGGTIQQCLERVTSRDVHFPSHFPCLSLGEYTALWR